jgi:hypothetical protein
MRHGAVLGAAVLAASAATASAAAPNPSANMPLATPASCSAPSSSACENAVVAGLNGARAALGLSAYTLPADFDSLAPDEQIFILSDSDRVAYGLPPVGGLSATLNAAAQAGVADDSDPDPQPDLPANLGDYGFGSNWAGGYANALLAYYGWMYDDGVGGPNLDCQSAADPGCWGHREDVLAFPDPGSLVMGAAAGTDAHGQPGYAMTIVWSADSWTTLSYTWIQALADIDGSPPSAGSGGSGSGASGVSGSGGGSGSGSGASGSGSGSGASGSGSGSGGVSGSGGGSGSGSGASGSGSHGRGSAGGAGSSGAASGSGSSAGSGGGGSSSGRGSSSGVGGSTGTPAPSGSSGAATPTTPTKKVPLAPVITQASVSATAHRARFVLRESGRASGLQCALVRDGVHTASPRYAACGSVRVYAHLARGRYTFYARAIGPAASVHSPARRSFSIR